MERTMEKTNIKIIITAIIIALISLSSVAIAADNFKKAEIKFSTITLEDKTKIETITLLLKGVSEAYVSTDDKILVVQYNSDEISSNMIVYTMTTLGYGGKLINDTEIATSE